MNYLGIDWGEKRIGLAYADELGVAVPLEAAIAATKKARIQHIEALIKLRRVDEIVCGYPLNMNGSVGFKAQQVDVFIREIKQRFGLTIHRIDERLSTYSVEQDFKQHKQKPDRRSGEIDSQAAALILQEFLEAKRIDLDTSIFCEFNS